MKRPDFALAEAIGWFLADHDVAPSTMRRYRSNLGLFCRWLPEDQRVLASLEPETVHRWVRTSTVHHTRMNRIIALRSFTKYLAERKLWYEGTDAVRLSVLRDVPVPQPSAKGTPAFRDDEVRSIVQHVPEGPTYLRLQAVIAVELHGFRAKEVRTMMLRNIIVPTHGEVMGHFIVDSRKQTKSNAGVRIVPMEPYAKDAIARYIRSGRPAFTGDGDEPLFLTEQGRPMSEDTWNSMLRRLRATLASASVNFKQHRFRSYRARQLHAAGVQDSWIIEMMGWEDGNAERMLRRYLGRVPLSTLKRHPLLIATVLGTAVG